MLSYSLFEVCLFVIGLLMATSPFVLLFIYYVNLKISNHLYLFKFLLFYVVLSVYSFIYLLYFFLFFIFKNLSFFKLFFINNYNHESKSKIAYKGKFIYFLF